MVDKVICQLNYTSGTVLLIQTFTFSHLKQIHSSFKVLKLPQIMASPQISTTMSFATWWLEILERNQVEHSFLPWHVSVRSVQIWHLLVFFRVLPEQSHMFISAITACYRINRIATKPFVDSSENKPKIYIHICYHIHASCQVHVYVQTADDISEIFENSKDVSTRYRIAVLAILDSQSQAFSETIACVFAISCINHNLSIMTVGRGDSLRCLWYVWQLDNSSDRMTSKCCWSEDSIPAKSRQQLPWFCTWFPKETIYIEITVRGFGWGLRVNLK